MVAKSPDETTKRKERYPFMVAELSTFVNKMELESAAEFAERLNQPQFVVHGREWQVLGVHVVKRVAAESLLEGGDAGKRVPGFIFWTNTPEVVAGGVAASGFLDGFPLG